MQVNDLLESEKLEHSDGADRSLRLPARDGFESLKGRSELVSGEVGCDLGLASFTRQDTVLKAEAEQAIGGRERKRERVFASLVVVEGLVWSARK